MMNSSGQRIVLLAALRRELRPLLKRLGGMKRGRINGLRLFQVYRQGIEILLLETGMGPRRAEMGARLALDRFKPELAVSCGFGGGLTADLPSGAVIQAERVVLYEPARHTLKEPLNTTWPKTDTTGPNLRPGTVVTAEQPPNKKTLGELLPASFHPAVVDMETYHTARIFLEAEIPFLSLRAVCDERDFDPDLDLERLTDGFGRIHAIKAVAYCLRHPGTMPRFLALARRSAPAAEALASVLEKVLAHIRSSAPNL
jgi:adenosylhomocysteine nucleosidase